MVVRLLMKNLGWDSWNLSRGWAAEKKPWKVNDSRSQDNLDETTACRLEFPIENEND